MGTSKCVIDYILYGLTSGDQLWMSGSKTDIPDLGPSESINFFSDKPENEESNETTEISSENDNKEENNINDASTDITRQSVGKSADIVIITDLIINNEIAQN